MIFGTFNNLNLILFIFLLILALFFLFLSHKKNNKILINIVLFTSFFFLIINVLEIKFLIKPENEKVKGGKIVFILDVSKSMNALDIEIKNKTYSRLEGTKYLIQKYVSKYTTNEYGLIIFAGESLEVIPLIENQNLFSTILYGINNSNISKYGTNFSSIFNNLEKYFITNEGGLAIIFTDGGSEKIELFDEKIKLLKEKNINIIIVGVGTIQGKQIPYGKDMFGKYTYKTYNGKNIITKLNNKELKNISLKYDFEYLTLKNEYDFINIENIINEKTNKNTQKIIRNKFNNMSVENNNNNNNNNNLLDLTRYFIMISFMFFILFLIIDNFLGKKQ